MYRYGLAISYKRVPIYDTHVLITSVCVGFASTNDHLTGIEESCTKVQYRIDIYSRYT